MPTTKERNMRNILIKKVYVCNQAILILGKRKQVPSHELTKNNTNKRKNK